MYEGHNRGHLRFILIINIFYLYVILAGKRTALVGGFQERIAQEGNVLVAPKVGGAGAVGGVAAAGAGKRGVCGAFRSAAGKLGTRSDACVASGFRDCPAIIRGVVGVVLVAVVARGLGGAGGVAGGFEGAGGEGFGSTVVVGWLFEGGWGRGRFVGGTQGGQVAVGEGR